MGASTLSRLLSVLEVCDRYGVGEKTVRSWLRSGELKGIHVGRKSGGLKARIRVTEAALAEFEAARSTAPPPRRASARRRPPTDIVEFIK
jgi:hypothetical protein